MAAPPQEPPALSSNADIDIDIASTLVKVRTTLPVLPLPPLSTRQPIETPRLILVPISQAHLEEYNWIRSRPELMVNSNQRRADNDISETQKWLNRFVPPNDADTCAFAITQKPEEWDAEDERKGKAIGMMGVVRMNRADECGTGRGCFAWPEVGYGVNLEFHGRGYATELLSGLLGMWWGLEREEVVVEMEARYVTGGEELVRDGKVGKEGGEEVVVDMRERVMAVTLVQNGPSLRVMEKCGLKRFAEWEEDEDHVIGCWMERPLSGV